MRYISSLRYSGVLLTMGFILGGLAEGKAAGTLAGSFAPIAAGSDVNLTIIGKLDWVHWGLHTAGSLNRKESVTPKIGNFSLVGDPFCSNCVLTVYQYGDNANGYTWYDGAPVTSVTNTTTGVWAYNYPMALGSGFQVEVPADTTLRTLQVFVGAYDAEGQLHAALSDGSAPAFTSLPNATVNNIGNGPSGVFTLNFAAGSAGQTLVVTWVAATQRGPTPNVTLQAAALTAAGADNPPFVTITSPADSANFPEPASVRLAADAQDFDGTVTNVTFYEGTTKLGQTTVAPFTFNWSGVSRGHYTITATATDNAGATSASEPVEIFVVGTGGSQTNAVEAAPLVADLTSEGTADWAHWGLLTNTSFDYKALVSRKISSFTVIGTNSVQNYSDNFTAFYWSDGTPTAAANGTPTGVYVAGLANGFTLTAPADTNLRQLRLYVGAYAADAQFQAYLSDFSAPAYSDIAPGAVAANSYQMYTIDYQAASSGQQLTVVYRAQNLFDPLYGNVTLQAATLQGGPVDALPVIIQGVQRNGNQVTFSFLTQSNFSYLVEYTDSLSPLSWTALTTVPGTGGVVVVTDPNANGAQRYYRATTQ